MSTGNPPRLVFVSHSGADTWVARQIAKEISTRGGQPFLDEADVDVGAEFEDDIRESLDKADELVVLFTPWALTRPYVWTEPRLFTSAPDIRGAALQGRSEGSFRSRKVCWGTSPLSPR
jgi:hypothetical protein